MSDDLTHLESRCETLKVENDELRAERDALRAALVEREAARNAYASEFPPDHEGKHAVGIILLNIRNLKSERDALRAELDRLTTLQPVSEHDGSEVLWWHDAGSVHSVHSHPMTAYWTPIPAAREEKRDE